MIVQCDRCLTRFRLPDTAVGERGAKARCSRCGNVFIVEKPPASDTQATLPPPAGYAGLTGVTAIQPQVSAPEDDPFGGSLITEGPPTTRTDVPGFLTPSTAAPSPVRPAPMPPPPAALGAFAPSAGARTAPAFESLPPPPTAPETSRPEQVLDQFLDIPPPLSSPPSGTAEIPTFAGPAFGRTAEVSQFSRASYVSFPPPPPAESRIPEAPGLDAGLDLPSWSVQDKETVRMEPSEIPGLDALPDLPESKSPPKSLKDTAEGDAFQLQSALEASAVVSDVPPPRTPRARAKTAGPTRRVEVGGLDFISSASKSSEPAPPEDRELPNWAVELAALLLAAAIVTPFLLAFEDSSSPLRPLVSFLSSAPESFAPDAFGTVIAEGVRVQSLLGAEKGVIVRGRVRNAAAVPIEGAEVVVFALDGDRVVESQRQALKAALEPDKPLDFAVVFPSGAVDYRPLRFRVEVAPARPVDADASGDKNP